MKIYQCDMDGCGKSVIKPAVSLSGYHPKRTSGILLPEHCIEKDFCSRECFVKFMRFALSKEDPSP